MPDRSGIDPARRPALHAGATRDLLRFITCGSVDDGKSTLIGRLLYDSRLIYQDQLARLREDSRKHGSLDGALDLALLVDGLQAEREQGITIDVAYRAFSTARRSFIVADAPGHEQYTRNMATGASTADLAVVLVYARKGLTEQTRRHTTILSDLGVGHLVLAINKMDLVDWSEAVYEPITADYRNFVAGLGHADMISIPASALTGDNIITPSSSMRWHRGPTLLEALETAPLTRLREHAPFRMPVQWVNRPNAAVRGYAGTVVSGLVRPGDPVMICPSGGRRSSATCMAMSETVTNRRGCLSSVASRPGHTNFIEGESDANNHLEHQFRASARSPGRPSPGGPATRHPVPARNQVSGRPVPN